jgi:5-hydroxyisourate hydrolase-like protein (transthyretin family)
MTNVYYRGDTLFLYAKFKDEQNKPISVVNPMVRIISEKDGEVVPLLDWQELFPLGTNEYFLNFTIPDEADYSSYEIIYVGEYDNKVARVVEDFHVIPRSTNQQQAVKLYGLVHQSRLGYPLIGVSVKISSSDNSQIISETSTKEDGKWEAYLYPGEYKFDFVKFGFSTETVVAQIGLEHNEIQFNNITLEPENMLNNGNGIYSVSDKYVTKEGIPLNGLQIKAFSVFDPSSPIAEDFTNDDGEYQIFLDPGMYLLKVFGNSLLEDFEQTFRLKISEDGETSFENLSENVGVPVEESNVDRGTGSVIVTDEVRDATGNPIVDVQVSVYLKSNLNTMIAQDYTGPGGKWEVYLNPGDYVFEFYHPEFHEFSENRAIR